MPINRKLRRMPGHLLPFETAICTAAAVLVEEGLGEFHGYELAKRLATVTGRSLTAYGTLYRALSRLERMGFLTSRRDDPEIAERENRPGRWLYQLTATGEAVAAEALASIRPKARQRRGHVVPA